ncbi:unnamed protein product [Nesidiocoris tenuis]|uniref:Uncharacterized protein n=1 Tax=Nesidiocoris tenuis TaxID=355587 RepID=A0A6H5HMQ0_9HEMI|nr:unnamed protein product [Nesidiocoris tenuis]
MRQVKFVPFSPLNLFVALLNQQYVVYSSVDPNWTSSWAEIRKWAEEARIRSSNPRDPRWTKQRRILSTRRHFESKPRTADLRLAEERGMRSRNHCKPASPANTAGDEAAAEFDSAAAAAKRANYPTADTQGDILCSTRQKPTGDVIQDKSDHNFLTNVTIVRRVKRQSLLRRYQLRRNPRIVHHRRPQLLPSMYPSPQPPPPHARPTHNHQVNLRPRPYHRRPNEYKYDSPDMKLTKHTSASSTLKPSPVDPSSTSKPNLRPQPVNPSYSPPDEANYYHTSSKQSTFRPSFGPPAYQQNHPSQIKHYQTQRPREREPTTQRPPTSYRSQVTKPPLEYPSSSTLRTFTERKPTSYVYASNNMHKESGLQLNHQPHTSEKVEDEGGGGSSSDPSDDEEEYEDDDEDEEEEDGTNEEQDRTKEEESREKNKSNENASVSKNSNENTFRPKFPDPPSGFYKDISSASVSSDEKNPFASPDFDFDKFLEELRDHPPAYTTPKSYFESASSSKESFPGNNYYYPKGTTPKYHSSVKDSIHKYPPHKEQTPKYVPANSYKPAGYYQSSKDSPYKSNFHTGETSPKYSSTYSSYPKESNKYGHQTLKQGPAMYYKPSSSAEQTTSKYFYSTLKENFNKYGNSNYSNPVQTTPITYDGFYPSKPYYGQTPSYQNNQHHSVVKSTTNSPFRISHPSLTTDRPMPGGVRHHQYYDDYVGGRGKNSSYVRQPKPPLAPMEPTRLQNIDSDSPEDEEEYSDENGEYEYDDDEEEGSEDEEDSNEDEYEDEEDEGSSNNEDASVTQERPESNESLRPRKPNPPASSSEYPTSTIKYTQNPKYFENSTPKQPNKPHFDRGRCSTIRGRTRCADHPSSTSTTALDQQLSLLYSTSTTFRPEDHQSNEYSSNEPTSQRPAGRLRMRRPTSPLPSPSPSTSATLSAPAHVFTSTYGTNSSRQTPMLLSPSYPKASTEPVSVAAVKPKQRQNRNKPVLSEETDMGDKGQTLRALTQMRASVTPSQQQYVQQQTTQQQQTTPPRAYNQSRYQSQYEPQFYSLYDEDVDLYKEIGENVTNVNF